MSTTSQNISKSIYLGSSFGRPQPQITIRLAKAANRRSVGAYLLRLAATVEAASPDSEFWLVRTEGDIDGGRVYLELDRGTPEETERGMALLKKLI